MPVVSVAALWEKPRLGIATLVLAPPTTANVYRARWFAFVQKKMAAHFDTALEAYLDGGDPKELLRAAALMLDCTVLPDGAQADTIAALTGCPYVLADYDDARRAVRRWFFLMGERARGPSPLAIRELRSHIAIPYRWEHMRTVWDYLSDPTNRGLIGGGVALLAAVVVALWTYGRRRRDRR